MSRSISKGQQRTTAVLSSGTGDHYFAAVDNNSSADLKGQFYLTEELLPYLTEDEKANLKQEVLSTINTELMLNTDLETSVPRLLRSCYNESRELRRAANSIASSQVVEAQRALQIVQDNYRKVQRLRQLFLKQGDLIQGLGTDTLSYKHLRQLHYLRDNVTSVIQWSEALKEVRYGNLYELLERQQFKDMYKRLKRLQKIRRTVITKAGARYRSFQTVFEPYFTKLDVILSLFVEDVFKFLREESMIVAIQKALDDDPMGNPQGSSSPNMNVVGSGGPVDPYVILTECLSICAEEVGNPVFNFGSDGVETDPRISEDGLFEAISKGIAQLWEDQIMGDVVDPFGQISVYLEQMRKVEPLLEAFELTLLPLSTSLSFFGLVARALHNEVMAVMKSYTNPDAEVEANGLIDASLFLQWYKEMLTTNNYTSYVDISKIDEISASCMTAAVGGLSAHLTRLCRACAMTVCNDPKGPTILPSGYPITTGPVDMFSVLQQSLSGLNASIDISVMRQIGKACADAIYAYLDECRQRSDFDYWEDENSALPTPQPAEEWQQQRMLFLYAFCNDCSNIETNLDTIELKFASCWEYDGGIEVNDSAESGGAAARGTDDKYATPFQKVQDALPDNAFYYLDEITAQVERLVGDQWAKAFRQGDWYVDTSNPIQLIVNTEAEYIEEEFATMLQVQRYRKLTRQLLVRYTEKYISTLVEFLADVIRNPKKNPVDDWNAFADCLTRDITLSVSMWGEHLTEKRSQLLGLMQRAMELLKELLTVSKPVDFGYVLQEKLLDDFGDCPTFVVHFCIDARSQLLPKETRARLMAVWQERIVYQQRDKADAPTAGWSQPPSFFGSIDRSIADLEKTTKLFGRSVKKKRETERQQKAKEDKDAKRAARLARRNADTAAVKVHSPIPLQSIGGGEVEVSALSDILKQS